MGNTLAKFVLKINIIGREGDQGGVGETDIKEKIKVDNYLSISNTEHTSDPTSLLS